MPPFISDRLRPISDQLSQAIIAAIPIPEGDGHDGWLLPDILHSISMWKSRPPFFMGMAYDWCSVICERPTDINEALLFLSLEIGFRHLDFRDGKVGGGRLTHTEHHHKMFDVVFKKGDSEVVADLLHTWTGNYPHYWQGQY